LARHAGSIYINFNGPVIVTGYNGLVRPFVNGSIFLANNIRGLFGGTPWNEIGSLPSNSQILSGLNMMDVPAARQMLITRINLNGVINNNLHDAWQTELRNMGYPQQSRNVAVSNGSECGVGQGFPPGATLLNVVGKANTRFLTDILGVIGMPLVGALTTQPAFLLGIVPGRNEFNFNFRCEAQPDGPTMQIYRGNISYTKKLLWLVNVNTTLTNRTRNSDASVLPIDNTSGGMYDTEFTFQSSSFQNWAIKYNLTVYNIPHFNFMPTVSALDIGSGNTALTINEYRAGYVGATPPAAPFNSPFANFTTAFNQVTVSNGTINNNENHIEISPRNGNFTAEELNGNVNVRTNCIAFCTSTEIAGNPLVCGQQVFTVPLVAGATYTWFPTTSALATLNATNNTFTVTRNGTARGTFTITVFITSPCGTITLNRNIEIGSNLGPVDFGGMPNPLCQGNLFNVYANNTYSNHIWSVQGGSVTSGQGTYEAHVYVNNLPAGQTTGYLEVALQAFDACNEQLPLVVKTSTVNDCIGGGIESRANHTNDPVKEAKPKVFSQVKLYPNPANSYVTLELPENYLGGTIKLLTFQGQILRRQPIANNLTRINVHGLTAGVYFAELISKDGQRDRKKIVVVQ
jgi:Secretion system C-terminal sorting domain